MGSIPVPVASAAATLWTLRSKSTLGVAAAAVSFTGLTDKAYRLFFQPSPTSTNSSRVTVNNDTGANYSQQQATAAAAAASAARNLGSIAWSLPYTATTATDLTAMVVAVIQKGLAAQHAFGTARESNWAVAAAGNLQWELSSLRWANTSALITRVDITASASTFKAGSIFEIAGIA